MNELSRKDLLRAALLAFNVTMYDYEEIPGNAVTLYKFRPQLGVRISKIRGLKDELASVLNVPSVRIIAPMSDGSVGIEIPNKERPILPLNEILSSEEYLSTNMELPLAIGKTVDNDVFLADLATMPHLLVAGATGQGKSVGLNVMLMSLLNKKKPDELKLVLIDPKKVELSAYEAIVRPYITMLEGHPGIITEASDAYDILDALCRLMDKRYTLLQSKGVRNIAEYNAVSDRKMEYYVIVIDEYGDLIMDKQYGRKLEYFICRLAQKARAVGMHMIISTQRPSATIVTGNIKANFPTRIAFRTTTGTDSRVVLDQVGAEKLLGRGDMLYFSGAEITRVQCAYIGTEEVLNRCRLIGAANINRKQKILRVAVENHEERDITEVLFGKKAKDNFMPFFYFSK